MSGDRKSARFQMLRSVEINCLMLESTLDHYPASSVKLEQHIFFTGRDSNSLGLRVPVIVWSGSGLGRDRDRAAVSQAFTTDDLFVCKSEVCRVPQTVLRLVESRERPDSQTEARHSCSEFSLL